MTIKTNIILFLASLLFHTVSSAQINIPEFDLFLTKNYVYGTPRSFLVSEKKFYKNDLIHATIIDTINEFQLELYRYSDTTFICFYNVNSATGHGMYKISEEALENQVRNYNEFGDIIFKLYRTGIWQIENGRQRMKFRFERSELISSDTLKLESDTF